MIKRKKEQAGADEAAEATEKSGKRPTKGDKKLSRIKSTQSFLPIRDVKDGIIQTKDDRYVKLMEFQPINFELRSPDEQATIISQFSAAIRSMPKTVHIKITTTPSDVTPFINDLRDRYNAEDNEGCRTLIADQMQYISNVSRTQGVSRRFFLSFEYEQGSGFRKRPTFEEIYQDLNRQARSIAASMEGCGNMLLSSDDKQYLLNALWTTICHQQSMEMTFEEHMAEVIERYSAYYERPVDMDEIPVNDFIAPRKMLFSLSPTYAVIDGLYTAYCYLPSGAYPVQALGGWLQVLFGYMDGVDVDFWIHKEDIEQVQRRLQLELKNNKIKSAHTDDVSQDYDDILSAIQSGYYIKQAIASGDDFCYMSTLLTITGHSLEELQYNYQQMYEYIVRNDMTMRRCYFQQEDAFMACIPLAAYNKRLFQKSRRNIMGSQLGSCYPFTAYELCDPGGVFMGLNSRYGSPVFINPFDTTKYQNANMLILGPSGTGKTYTLMCYLLRMRQRGYPVYILAPLKGFEFKRACDAIGGEYVRIAPGSGQNINIMEIRKKDMSDSILLDGEKEGTSGSILTDKIQQILRFFAILMPDITSEERQLLDEALIKTYERFRITTRNKSLIDPASPDRYRPMPLLGDLLATLEDMGEGSRRIRNALSRFVTGSAKSFNLPTNVNLDNKFVVIDVSDLTTELLPVGMFIALDYVMDKAKANRTEQKIVAIDEMWRLMKASPLSADFVVEAFKILRGYGGSVIGATQDMDDIGRNEYGSAIINNTKIKLLLPLDKKEANAVTKVIELSSEELQQLKKTETRRTSSGKRRSSKALMVANNNHVFIDIQASQTEHDLITTDAKELRRIAREKAAALSRRGV